MAKRTRLTIAVESAPAQSPHSTFATEGDTEMHDVLTVVPGIGDGLGKVKGASAVFEIASLSQATTYDLYGGFDLYSFSNTSLDVVATSVFSPDRDGPDFEPVTVAHFQAGPLMFMAAGIGTPMNALRQQSAPTRLDDLKSQHVEDGFVIDVEAGSMATPYVNGIPNPTGVLGGLYSYAVVLYDVEAKNFGRGDDKVKGSAAADAVALGAGDDSFQGRGGNDAAVGGRGADRMWGQGGDDWLSGGTGKDKISGGDGSDTLSGSEGSDLLKGGRGDDELRGGAGKDRMLGGSGGDDLFGGGGKDWLVGGSGNDDLRGGSGIDRLAGGRGDDTLIGGAGADRFDFRVLHGDDEVRDFEVGVDRLLVTAQFAADLREFAGQTFDDDGEIRLTSDAEERVDWGIRFAGVTAVDDLIDALIIV